MFLQQKNDQGPSCLGTMQMTFTRDSLCMKCQLSMWNIDMIHYKNFEVPKFLCGKLTRRNNISSFLHFRWRCCWHSFSFGLSSYLLNSNSLGRRNIGRVRLHQIPVIPESESRSVPFDYTIPESEWPEFNSGDSGPKAEF